jgi:hypothetical protein
VIVALSLYEMTWACGDRGFWLFAHSKMLLSVGLPPILVRITAASYDDLPPGNTDQASALLSASTYTEKSRPPSLPNSRGARQPVSLSKIYYDMIYYDIRHWLRAADEHISRPRFVERFGTIGVIRQPGRCLSKAPKPTLNLSRYRCGAVPKNTFPRPWEPIKASLIFWRATANR